MILVTGGTGLVGSNLLIELSKTHSNIVAIKRVSSNLKYVSDLFKLNNLSINFKNIKWFDVDLTDFFSLKELFDANNFKYVYHCAAEISYRKKDNLLLYENNVTSTKYLVDLAVCSKVQKFCYVSSIATLGTNKDGEITEQTEFNFDKKTSGYSTSKYYAELEVWRGIAEGLNAIIINPSVIIGAGNWKTGSSSMFGIIKRGLKFYTKGVTGFVDVRDVVSIMIKLANSELRSQRYIVSSENINYKNFFCLVAKYLQVKCPSIYATKFLTSLAWRLEFVKSILLNKQPVITYYSAQTSHKKLEYSNEKIINALNYNFIKIEESVQFYAKLYQIENM
jgi:nucleoside-diphosphate-sugar epimerase